MIGTIVNVASVLGGSTVGVLFKGKFPEKVQNTVIHGISLAVILIGMQMAFSIEKDPDILLVIFSLVIGAVVGELMQLEKRLNDFGGSLKDKFGGEDDLFVQGFVQASLIYCVGAMAIMGSIQDGLNNDPSILFTKSLLDGITSIAFAASTGIGVAFSVIPILIYQGSITLAANWAAVYLTEDMIRIMTASGGLLITAIGLNMLGVSKIKTGNLLPTLLVAVVLSAFVF
ncbi:DUF554 domain-containing protein [Halanaerobium congolense]|jgi:hypothetical protein|uniref:Membrane protein YdfK n=1 Tax=Halanaerobium congolense TaxID=54121 RepID=A0A1G6IL23_9FIRM|nr:DUF554 domain-containing protein [Halanaerobium congolense]KXS50382.1 MAG: hypothetical protein AWL62_206 [Halanaerobium sp. T82-1]OEG62076.1 MAG: hypothetical protein BHK79_07555 [Halanaerobium sp. MDAL1]PUU92359.1 MAG: hypothetical protein CI948_693 [Halanaerobium sp.]PTX15940.1 hypothetical protein C7953_0627 [Halanaerobium congolense]PXV64533.1 hypothetical protein C8C78_11742 [Halanaerobium congolense]